MWSRVQLCGALFFLTFCAHAQFDIITYANNQVLRSSDGTIYYHTGEVFIDTRGKVYYPKWLGGGDLRANEGAGSYPYRAYYANGNLLAEYRSQLYYPMPQGATIRYQLFDDWNYKYNDGSEWLSTNWRDAQSIKHKKFGRMAWDGTTLRDPHTNIVERLAIVEPLGDESFEGALFMLLDNTSGDSLKMETHFFFDLWRSSYIHPVVLESSTGLPQTFFEDVTFKIETGYWGELVTVRVKRDAVTSKFSPASIPFPGGPWPCPSSLLGQAGFQRHQLTERHVDHPTFVRKERR